MFIFFSKIPKMNGDLEITMHTSKAVYENLFPDISRFSRVTPDVPLYVPTKTSVINITSYILVEKCDTQTSYTHKTETENEDRHFYLDKVILASSI